VGCITSLNGYFFDLKPLSITPNEAVPEESEAYNVKYSTEDGENTIQFNLCEPTVRKCPDMMGDFANIINANNTCNHLSHILDDDETTVPFDLSLIEESHPDLGLIMRYTGGNKCNETANYQLVIQINCNPNIDKVTYSLDKESLKSPCDPLVIMNSPHGCPVMNIGPLGQVIEKAKYFIGLPMILIGIFFLGVGGRYPTTSFLLFTTLTVGCFLLFSIFMFLLPSEYMPEWTVYVLSVVCYSMGAGLGYGAAKWPKMGIAVIAFTIGGTIASFFHGAIVTGNTLGASHMFIDWALTLGGGLIAALICIFLFDFAVILGSGICGAYLLLRVSFYLSHLM
jgi:hypothetical protein